MRRFVFDDTIIPPGQTAEIIATSAAHFAQSGYGLWLARHGDAVVGFAGFWFFRDPPELELLYGIADDCRRRGYGREGARAVVAHGFGVLKMDTIRASTDAAHVASRRLLEDVGFTFDRRATVDGLDTVFYMLRASDRSAG